MEQNTRPVTPANCVKRTQGNSSTNTNQVKSLAAPQAFFIAILCQLSDSGNTLDE